MEFSAESRIKALDWCSRVLREYANDNVDSRHSEIRNFFEDFIPIETFSVAVAANFYPLFFIDLGLQINKPIDVYKFIKCNPLRNAWHSKQISHFLNILHFSLD